MFCKNCGNKLENSVKFCDGCGAKVEAAPAQPVNVQSPGMQQNVQQKVQPAPMQQTYSQPSQPARPTYDAAPANDPPLGVGQYLAMLLLLCIPIANIILLFVWAFGSTVNKNKKNYARAVLILTAIGVVVYILIGGFIVGVLNSLGGLGGFDL